MGSGSNFAPNSGLASRRVIFGNWKRAMIFGLSVGIGIIVSVALIGAAIWKYQTRTTPVHVWSVIQLPQVGVKAFLKTQAQEGQLRYQFYVRPISSDLRDAFSQAANDRKAVRDFSIILYDANGFDLCRGDLDGFTRAIDNEGRVAALESNGTLFRCSVDEYVSAQSWNVTYHFPDLRAMNPPTPSSIQAPLTKPVRQRMGDSVGDDVLTGASYDGNLETEAGHTFHVRRQGEVQTTWGWMAS